MAVCLVLTIGVDPSRIGPPVSGVKGPQQSWMEPSDPIRQTLSSLRAKKTWCPSVAASATGVASVEPFVREVPSRCRIQISLWAIAQMTSLTTIDAIG